MKTRRVQRWAASRREAPLALLAVVLCADGALALLDPSVQGWEGLLLAALDEPAHLATVALVLLALPRPSTQLVAAALVAGVAIDLDHIPAQLFGSDALTEGTPRPYTHTLLGAAAVAALAAVAARRRAVAAGVAIGLVAHLARDVATGGGVALLWPFTDEAARVPHAAYLVAVTALAGVAVAAAPRRRPAAT